MNPANFGPGKELFTIDRTDKLRVFVNVPQAYATLVRVGQTADYLVRNYPGAAFPGTVTRTTGAVDPATRTLKVQVDVNNPKGLLFPGMYGQVKFGITQDKPPVTIPTSALVYNAEGMRIATVAENNKVHFKKVTVGRDFGTEAEVTEGLDGDERIVTNPGEKLAEGKEVKVIGAARAAGKRPAARRGGEVRDASYVARASRPWSPGTPGCPMVLRRNLPERSDLLFVCGRASRRSLALLLIRTEYGPTPWSTRAPRARRPCHELIQKVLQTQQEASSDE